jgi:hypothetical protein
VSQNLLARQFILPLLIFVPATLGLIWQQSKYPGSVGAPPVRAGEGGGHSSRK